MQHHDTAQVIADVANKTQYTASAASVVLSFINEYAAAIGILIAFAGFCVNSYFRYMEYRLKKKQAKEEE
jgi:hypothetical protein